MKFARVIGKVVATKKPDNLNSLPLLVVNQLDKNLKSSTKILVCTDTADANQGDIVLICRSSSSRKTARTRYVCTDASIVGIVDNVNYS
jgi:microcompartment protein CcmK/EutM